MHKLCKGKVPSLHLDILDDADKTLFAELTNTKLRIENLLESYKFRDALFEVIDLARKGNKYMQDKEPWIVAKQLGDNGQPTVDAQKLIDNCLHLCLQLTANLAVFVNPFLPFAAKKMCHMMKVVDKILEWENAGSKNLLSVGYSLREPQLLFRKIEDTEVAEQVEKLKLKSQQIKMENDKSQSTGSVPSSEVQTIAAASNEKVFSEINFDDFAKIALKVGTILSAEKVAKADKLLKLEVDMGTELRTIVSGIALHFSPEQIIGQQVVVVANLAPRKMKGIESNGMILMAEDKSGKLHFVSPANVIDNGSGVS
jgi:methionyl-tRNA synthetase